MDTTTEQDATPTGITIGLPGRDETQTRTIADLVEETGYLKHRTRILVEDSSQLHRDTLDQLLRTDTGARSRENIDRLLERLSELGFSWRDISRVVGVTIPALRKWRAGESATGENKRRVAELVAFCEIVGDNYLVEDVASWVEVPLVPEVPLNGLDLLIAGRFDLLFRWAGDPGADPEDLLDEYQPDWRSDFESDVEVFQAPDGEKGLRFRSARGE